MFSNRYIFIYSAVMVIIVAVFLTLVSIGLKPQQEFNIRVEKMQNILSSVNVPTTKENAEELFNKYIIDQKVYDINGNEKNDIKAFDVNVEEESKKPEEKRLLPIYVCKLEDGSQKYIIPMYGKGLWGPIWGYISLNDDKNTIYGAFFDHKGETPGLGAEIATPEFQKQFVGKKIFDDNGNFVSVKAIKGGAAPDDVHGVNAITGGTITSKGLTKMLFDEIKPYQNILSKK